MVNVQTGMASVTMSGELKNKMRVLCVDWLVCAVLNVKTKAFRWQE